MPTSLPLSSPYLVLPFNSGTQQARSGFEQSPPAITGELMGLSSFMTSQIRQVNYIIITTRRATQVGDGFVVMIISLILAWVI